ncbi:MAG: hypothetical protein QM776_15515 [Rhodocyclaceae bacterium]
MFPRALSGVFIGTGLLLQACGTASVSGVSFTGRVQPPNEFCDSRDLVKQAACTPELKNAIAFAPLGQSITFNVQGVGKCDEAVLDFGDGSSVKLFGVSSWPFTDTHVYTGWPGVKNVRVKGTVNCAGDVTVPLNVGFSPDGRLIYRLGFGPVTSVCAQVPNMPMVRAGSVVRLEADSGKIRYGAPAFDASGDRAVTAPTTFAFPSMRPFSLVYRVGTQITQGEVGRVIFRASQNAPLEICVNDHPQQLADNLGEPGIRIDIAIAEPSVIP